MKLLMLLPRVPYPLEKGDKLRAFHQLRYLSSFCEVHLCCLNDAGDIPGAAAALAPYCKSLTIIPLKGTGICWNVFATLFTGIPFQAGYFYSHKANRKIHQLIKEIAPDHIYCQLLRVARYVKDVKIPKTIDYQDIFSKGYERQAENHSWIMRPVYNREARRLRKYEEQIFSWFDHHCIISETDRRELSFAGKEQVAIIRNGVDMDYYVPGEGEKDTEIVFTGNMNYPPNVLGAEFLVNGILPAVQKELPGTRVMIAGANPSPRVQGLASDQVKVTGWLEDIRQAFDRSKVFVAPMMIGTGLQNKLLEAMAMKVPCVTSPLANSALGAQRESEILVCETIEEYAKAITGLLRDPERRKSQAESAYAFVKSHYSWESETRKLFELMQADSRVA